MRIITAIHPKYLAVLLFEAVMAGALGTGGGAPCAGVTGLAKYTCLVRTVGSRNDELGPPILSWCASLLLGLVHRPQAAVVFFALRALTTFFVLFLK